jgi:peptidoglycan/LPS O-acetylase OafA/YrhL
MAFLRLPARARSWPIAAGIALIVVGIVFQKQIPYPIMHSGLPAPAFALIIFGFATQPAWTRFLAVKPMLLLGEASYSLYLLHLFGIILLAFFFHLAGSPHIIGIVVLYLIGICALSIGVFLFIESPLRRVLRPRPRREKAVETTQVSVSM